MEETEGAYVQGQFATDTVCHKEFPYAGSSSCELTMEQIPQLRQAFAIIKNVCKTSSTVWVNKQQCKHMADSFSAVGEELKGWKWDRSLVHSEPSDGDRNKKYPALDKLLTVLRKGEILVSYYNTWNSRVYGLIDSREATFKDITEELDIIKAQFHFQGPADIGHEQGLEPTSELRRAHILIEKSEMEEMARDPHLVASIRKSEQTTGIDVDMMKPDIIRQVTEGIYEVNRANDLVVREKNSEEVCKATWNGVPYALKGFGTYLPAWVVQQELEFFTIKGLLINKLSRLSVGCNEQGSTAMDWMNLKELIDSQRLRSPVSKEHCVTVPLNFQCEVLEILLELERGMAYLHPNEMAHRDLKAANVLLPSIKTVKLVDFDSTIYKGSGRDGCRLEHEALQFEIVDCPKLVYVYSFGETCNEVLTGSMRKTTSSKILYSEEQEEILVHLCDEEWRENGNIKYVWLIYTDLVDDLVDQEISLEALKVSAFQTDGSASGEIGTCENSSRFVEDDEAQPRRAIPPENALDSCTQETTSNSPILVQQDLTEIPSEQQTPDFEMPARERNRSRIWSDDEKLALLELTEEAPRSAVVPDWGYVSDNLLDDYGYDRASISCQQQWCALLHSYRAIQDHESKIQSGTSSWVSYWKMNEDERFDNKLQRAFDFQWFEVIERILAAKPFELEENRIFQMDADHPPSASPLVGFQSRDEVLDDESTDEESEEIDMQSEDEHLSVDSMATLESQVEVTADSDDPEYPDEAKQSHEPCHETNSQHKQFHVNEQSRTKSFCETISKYAGRKRSGENDLINSRIAPFVNKQVDDALKPLNAVLRRREENEQKHQEELLAIEEEKLTLKSEKMEFRRRALASSTELPEPEFTTKEVRTKGLTASDIAPK